MLRLIWRWLVGAREDILPPPDRATRRDCYHTWEIDDVNSVN
jgi:hypothetical protein